MNNLRAVSRATSKKRRRMLILLLTVVAILVIAAITTAVVIVVLRCRQKTTTPISGTSALITKSTTITITTTATTKVTSAETTTATTKVTSAETTTATTKVTSAETTTGSMISTETTTESITSTQTTPGGITSTETTTESETSTQTTPESMISTATTTESITSTETTTESETSTATTPESMISTETTPESITSTQTTTESETSAETTTEATTDYTISDQNVKCVFPFAQSPSGRCVNILIDFDNCGSVGYVCPANYTSCSAGLCSIAPGVQLTDPIPIFTAAVNGSVDDRFYGVAVPFSITLYNTTTDFVQVTTNGVLCLGKCSTDYTETVLPTSAFSGATALPYWDDLYIFGNTSQGIYYQSEGTAPNRTLIFEYYCSHYQQDTEYYHFQAKFFEAIPGVVQFIYYDISDQGTSCTVGVQGSSRGPFIQHSFHRRNSVTNNMVLTFDTNVGRYTNSSLI